MKRRFAALFLCVCCALCGLSVRAADNMVEVSGFDIIVLGEILPEGTKMLSHGSVWLVPLRAAALMLGIPNEKIMWHSADSVVTVDTDDAKIALSAGKSSFKIGGKEIPLESAAIFHNGEMFVPFDFLEKAFGCIVMWDEVRGRVYIQNADTYEAVYTILKNSVVCDPDKANKLKYEYSSITEITDAENGYCINRSGLSGNVEYAFRTGECIDRGVSQNYGGMAEFENRAKGNVLYCTLLGKNEKKTDAEGADAFIDSMLKNAFLYRVDGMIKTLDVAGDDSADGYSITPLKRLAMVLKIKGNQDVATVSGSVLGIQSTLRNNTVKEYSITYQIDRKNGKILKAGEKTVTQKHEHGIDVLYASEWICAYSAQ